MDDIVAFAEMQNGVRNNGDKIFMGKDIVMSMYEEE
jgi:hypothetical protein